MEVKGIHVKEHFRIEFGEREGEAFAELLESAVASDEFPMNEFEEEIAQAVVEVLQD